MCKEFVNGKCIVCEHPNPPILFIPKNFSFEKFKKEFEKIRAGEMVCKVFKPNKKIKDLV